MHKSVRLVFTFGLLMSSLVMLAAMPVFSQNSLFSDAMAQGYDYDYDNYYGDNTYSKYSTYDNKYECRTGPFEGFFVSSVEFCKNVKFDNKDDSKKNNRDTGTGPQSFACQNVNIVPNTNTIDVDNTNTNTAAVAATNTSQPFQQQDKNSNLDTPVNGQQVTPEKILNSLFGNNTNGDAEPLNFDICINVNNNNIIQQQQVAAAAGQNVNVADNTQEAG